MKFKLESTFAPTGDQPQAIGQLTQSVTAGKRHQTLLGVTGSGKTFTVANVIQNTQKPTLVISHNKTLAAQLYQEFRDFFPENAVSYFVSYYDYYQPEAYIPATDTYIEKETDINDEIDKLRLSATTNLLTRPDVIVVASVSCIYNLGSPVEYGKYILEIIEGQIVARESLLARLTDLQYDRSDYELARGTFRVKGDTIQIWPAYEDYALNLETLENRIETIKKIDPTTGTTIKETSPDDGHKNTRFILYPAKHYITNPKTQHQAFAEIRHDLTERLNLLRTQGKIVEAYRLEQKVSYDLEMIEQFGFVNGIENYSRYFDGRSPGDPPFTLIDYFHENAKLFNTSGFLTVIDESHMSIPQIRGMHAGDQSRKQTLIDYGFRLPAALDNRPLRFDEFQARIPQTLYTSATPNDWEVSVSGGTVVEQLIRPTGLVDPDVEVRKTHGQIEDLTREIVARKKRGQRVLVTTLTKRMAEDLTEYLNDEEKMTNLIWKQSIDERGTLNNHARHPAPPGESGEPGDTGSLRQRKTLNQVQGDDSLILPKVQYLHADVATLDRSDILDNLRKGDYDVIVGINLLREGLDLPEVSLVAILDADKEGFLRSRTSLVQTMGRAARHEEGHVIMYADTVTGSMQGAIDEVRRRRQIQLAYNQKHHLTPRSIQKPIRQQLVKREKENPPTTNVIQLSKKESLDLDKLDPSALTPQDKNKLARALTRRMNSAAKSMDFELAAKLRDTLSLLKQ